jgi:membrane protease YdiL (CAAX protease family)
MGLWLLLVGMFAMAPALDLAGIPRPSNDPAAPRPTDYQRALQAFISQAVSMLPVVLYFLWRVSRAPQGLVRAGVVPHRPARELVAGAFALLAALPMVLGSAVICTLITRHLLNIEPPKVGHDLLKTLLESSDIAVISLIAISAVLVAPILEEIMFRGLMQTALLDVFGHNRRWFVIVVTSIVFALIHTGGVVWQVMPGLTILGLMLGWLYEKHGSLLPGIVLHMLFNAANIGLGMLI